MGSLVCWRGNFRGAKRTGCVLGRMSVSPSSDCWGLWELRGLSTLTNRRSVGFQIGSWANRWAL